MASKRHFRKHACEAEPTLAVEESSENNMPKTSRPQHDPLQLLIEGALQSGRFIPYSEGWGFTSHLGAVADQIQGLLASESARAAELYEMFLAGCNKKAEEIDDSDGYLGEFAEGLICRWIRARQAANAAPDETAKRLLDWMDDDPYGFCSSVERRAAEAFDRTGLEAFERLVRKRFDAGGGNWWANILRAVYSAQRDVERYVELCRATEFTPGDCETIAGMLQAKRKFADALAWVERGIKLQEGERFPVTGCGLAGMKRQLLKRLGRGEEALTSAWAAFEAYPSELAYSELMRYVPKDRRSEWHEKAMLAADGGDLGSLIGLCLATKETDRLVRRLQNASDREIENLSHYTTEPAAKHLAKPHPEVAARVYRALGMRILNSGKSKYYGAALENFQAAKSCYMKAGQPHEWEMVMSQVRSAHHRKYGFMPGFEKVAACR